MSGDDNNKLKNSVERCDSHVAGEPYVRHIIPQNAESKGQIKLS